jgi:hypothetical protein
MARWAEPPDRYPGTRVPRFWLITQALIVVFVLAGMIIAVTKL